MTCREHQFRIGTEREAELAGDVALQAHLGQCADCRQLRQEMRQLSAATSLLQPLPPPPAFAQRIRQEVRKTSPVKSAGFLERLIGPLRAPAPALQRQHVFAGVAVLLVALVLLAVLMHPVGFSNNTPSISVPSMVQPGGGQPVDFPSTQPNQFHGTSAPAHAP